MGFVPAGKIVAIGFTLAVTVLLPAGIWIFMALKIKRISGVIIAGMIGFAVPPACDPHTGPAASVGDGRDEGVL